jgi:hypothetical protein
MLFSVHGTQPAAGLLLSCALCCMGRQLGAGSCRRCCCNGCLLPVEHYPEILQSKSGDISNLVSMFCSRTPRIQLPAFCSRAAWRRGAACQAMQAQDYYLYDTQQLQFCCFTSCWGPSGLQACSAALSLLLTSSEMVPSMSASAACCSINSSPSLNYSSDRSGSSSGSSTQGTCDLHTCIC